MEKVRILGIWHNATRKDGTPYISQKTGQPYEMCSIKDEKGYINGFGNTTTKAWKIGDTIDLEIIQNGQYRNFKFPSKNVTREEFDSLVRRIELLEQHTLKDTLPEVPENINEELGVD